MTNRLVRGMYTSVQPRSNLFGLHADQMASPLLVKNAGWYNKAGEKLGFGDLSPDNARRIASELTHDELFIVLGEDDSRGVFVRRDPKIAKRQLVEHAPGVKYMQEKARLIIANSVVYYVDPLTKESSVQGTYRNFPCTVLSVQRAAQLIKEYR